MDKSDRNACSAPSGGPGVRRKRGNRRPGGLVGIATLATGDRAALWGLTTVVTAVQACEWA